MKLISKEYVEQNTILHDTKEGYGSTGHQFAKNITLLCRDNKYQSILDYGCGKGLLKSTLEKNKVNFQISEYDPAISAKNTLPSKTDLVVCFDVLEHVEPEYLDTVLLHIKELAHKCTMLSISNQKSSQTLSDGRNAHLTIEQHPWWSEKLANYFQIAYNEELHQPDGSLTGSHFYIAVPN